MVETGKIGKKVSQALEMGEGILHMVPAWVPRTFVAPGRRMKIAPQDLFAFGAQRGGIIERWFSATNPADNGPGTLPDEGMSYIAAPSGKILFKDAIQEDGASIIGSPLMSKYGRWPVFAKFFDCMGPIQHHLHPREEHAALVGRQPKPEAYYFPPQMNFVDNLFPYTFFGLEQGTSREDIRKCLENWDKGDNGILSLSRAYKIDPGTGWYVPGGILHAPGSLLTFEPQWASDVFAMYQSLSDGRAVDRALLTRDVPKDKHYDFDYLVDLIDWEENTRPDFKEKYFRMPKIDAALNGDGCFDTWVSYDTNGLFSAKELTVKPGAECVLNDKGPSGVIAVQGHGTLGVHDVHSPVMIRFNELTQDEFFITDKAAKNGIKVKNNGYEPLVLLRYFGPTNA